MFLEGFAAVLASPRSPYAQLPIPDPEDPGTYPQALRVVAARSGADLDALLLLDHDDGVALAKYCSLINRWVRVERDLQRGAPASPPVRRHELRVRGILFLLALLVAAVSSVALVLE